MADIVYFSGELDENGEVLFRRVQSEAAFNTARLVIEAIKRTASPVHAIVLTDPTIAAFHEPLDPPIDSEQGDG